MSNPNLTNKKEELTAADVVFENNIRPAVIADFSGQDQIIENLRIFIKAAKIRRSTGSRVVSWSSGPGKTTLSRIVANELGVNIKETSGPVIENQVTLQVCLPASKQTMYYLLMKYTGSVQ